MQINRFVSKEWNSQIENILSEKDQKGYCFLCCSQGITLTPTSSGQLQFPLINVSQLKAQLDKTHQGSVKLEPPSPQMKAGAASTSGGVMTTVAAPTVTLSAQVNLAIRHPSGKHTTSKQCLISVDASY